MEHKHLTLSNEERKLLSQGLWALLSLDELKIWLHDKPFDRKKATDLLKRIDYNPLPISKKNLEKLFKRLRDPDLDPCLN